MSLFDRREGVCYCLTECKWYIIGWQEGVGVSLVDNVVDRLLCVANRRTSSLGSGGMGWSVFLVDLRRHNTFTSNRIPGQY